MVQAAVKLLPHSASLISRLIFARAWTLAMMPSKLADVDTDTAAVKVASTCRADILR